MGKRRSNGTNLVSAFVDTMMDSNQKPVFLCEFDCLSQ